MAILCVLDTETTGLDVKRDKIIELGWVLYDADSKQVYQKACYLIKNENTHIEPHLTEIHGIDDSLVSRFGSPAQEVYERFNGDASKADYLVAHNAFGFDKPILESNFSSLVSRPWLDTKSQMPYPATMKSRRLIHLAAEHGVQIRRAHRALDDVEMLVDIIRQYPIEEILETREKRELRRLKI